MEVMTDFSPDRRRVEVVLSGAVTVASLEPVRGCLLQLFSGSDTYLIRAADVTSVDIAAARMLQALVSELIARGATVQWTAASRSVFSTARALELDRPLGLTCAVPV
jgi:ABC-type transporter Mla MlaB component